MESICVYCGSNFGRVEDYSVAAKELANSLVKRNIRLVYGGANVGVMGLLADAVLQEGGEVVGVIPEKLISKEIAHEGLTELHVTKSMHERKELMAKLADGFIALPGGIGTLEELFEAWTWAQLGFHAKPCGLLNTNGYYDYLTKFLDHTVKEQFVKQPHRSMLILDKDPEALLDKLFSYEAPTVGKWM